MPDLGADMKRHQYKPARPQHPVDLREGTMQFAGLQVDDRVQGDGGPELTVSRG